MPPNGPPLPSLSRPPVTPKPSTRGLCDEKRLVICQMLLLGWDNKSIAERQGASIASVYRVASNLRTYGSVRKPPAEDDKPLGRPRKLTEEDEEALFEELVRSGWMQHHEMVRWLQTERGVRVSRASVTRLVKERKWSPRTIELYSTNRNEDSQSTTSKDPSATTATGS